MKYFLHDSSSFEDEKISMLFMEHGYEGLGLFYTILEKLAKQEKPVNTKVLKMQLKVGKKLEKCWKFMEDIDIISSKNGETFNKRLLKFGESMDEKREKTSKRVSQHRDNQKEEKNVTRYSSVSNAPNITKHNITKEESTYVDVVEENSKPKNEIEDIPHFVIQNRNELIEDLKENPPKLREAPPSWQEMEVILINAAEMRNTACKNNNLNQDEYLISVSRFIGDQKAKGKPVKSEGDVRSHFLYWLPKWIQIRKREIQAEADTGPPKGKIQQAIEGTRSAADELRRRRALNNS